MCPSLHAPAPHKGSGRVFGNEREMILARRIYPSATVHRRARCCTHKCRVVALDWSFTKGGQREQKNHLSQGAVQLKKGFTWTDSGTGSSATLSHVLSAGDRTGGGEYASWFQLKVVEVCIPVTPAKYIIMKTASLPTCHWSLSCRIALALLDLLL
jgi:hypothetical protein